MSFFPGSFISAPSTSFHPLVRLLDDFDQYSQGRGTNGSHQSRSHLKTFSPKFDVKEVEDAYELHGELPGIEQKDVEIEFTDSQTLTIKGRSERSYTSGTPPSSTQGAIEGGESNGKAHKATVEDEDAATSTEVTKTKGHSQEVGQAKEPGAKFWVSERSVGEFSRSFSFPTRVDQDAVRASMKNGILSIVVPKAKKQESRKIAIN